MAKRDEALAMIEQGLDQLRARDSNESPISILASLIPPGVTLRTGGSVTRGGAHYYLSMPTTWQKPENAGWWMYNENGGYYWTSSWAPTKHDALLAGLARLCTVLQREPGPYEPNMKGDGQR